MIQRIYVLLFLICMPLTASFAQSEPKGIEVEQIPYEFIVEAEQFLNRCSTTAQFFQYYNCDCLAANFLDERIKDPFAQEGIIVMRIKSQCIDPIEAVGKEYTHCMQSGTIFPDGVDPASYCECFAREYGRIYRVAGKSPSSRLITAVTARAHLNCQP